MGVLAYFGFGQNEKKPFVRSYTIDIRNTSLACKVGKSVVNTNNT